MNSTPSRKESWVPPARPEWVMRINEEGAYLDVRSVVSLDPDNLIATARANTGLADFGAEPWEEAFRRYTTSVDLEGDLHFMGRLMARSDLLMVLEARLKVEDLYRRHPEIDSEQIDSPIWIFGPGRSGTSLLQTLMGFDPASRSPLQCESLFPTECNDPARRELANHRIEQWNRVTPQIASMHQFTSELQAETIQFEVMSFHCPVWINLFGMAPSYNAWCDTQPYQIAYRYLKRVLKAMQWLDVQAGKPRRLWILKSPYSINTLPQALDVFPDARLVWAHRDPVKTMASAVSLVSTLTWIRSDRRFPDGAFDGTTRPDVVLTALSRPIEWLKDGTIRKDRLCSIQYADLIANPLATLRQVYDFHGIPFRDEAVAAIQGYLNANPRTARPAHSYSLGEEAQLLQEREIFRPYQEYFQVPNEF